MPILCPPDTHTSDERVPPRHRERPTGPQTGDPPTPVASGRYPERGSCPRDAVMATEQHPEKPAERAMDSPLPNREISPTALMYYSCKNGARGACHGDSILDPAGYRDVGRQPSQSSGPSHEECIAAPQFPNQDEANGQIIILC